MAKLLGLEPILARHPFTPQKPIDCLQERFLLQRRNALYLLNPTH